MSILKAEELHKSFIFKKELSKILNGICLELAADEFISIVGPSGCGKTTLLEILAGISRPEKGRIYYDGKDITGKTGYLGYMPQEDLLFPWLKSIDNILLPVRIKGGNLKAERQKATKLLPIFGLEKHREHLPYQLSGGLKQRVALARTYMTGSRVLLLDEPLANLDAITRADLQDWLKELVKSLGLAVILVTHDIDEAIRLSRRILVMNQGSFIAEFKLPEALDEMQHKALKEEILAKLD